MEICPKCNSPKIVKSGIVKEKQRYKCKDCNYYFTVNKIGKQIDNYYVIKALQLYLEGLTYREIERIIGVSHVSVMNWVRDYGIKKPKNYNYFPQYRILRHEELVTYVSDISNVQSKGLVITQIGDKYMVIRWDRFRE